MAKNGAHDGRVAIVTGAASGIGRAVVERLVDEGGSVVAIDRVGSGLTWLATSQHQDRIAPFIGDITSEAVNDQAVATAMERFGRLDVSVLNAGVSKSGDLLAMPLDEFDDAMNVNVRSVLLGIRAAVPAMRAAGGGSIVVTASTSGLAGDPNMWAYNASKGAVVNLVRATALDLGRENIRVNAVCPGPTETGMTERIQKAPAMYESLRSRIAMKRWGRAEEVASVISFLASTDASFVTGVAIPVDGGITANTGQFTPLE